MAVAVSSMKHLCYKSLWDNCVRGADQLILECVEEHRVEVCMLSRKGEDRSSIYRICPQDYWFEVCTDTTPHSKCVIYYAYKVLTSLFPVHLVSITG